MFEVQGAQITNKTYTPEINNVRGGDLVTTLWQT